MLMILFYLPSCKKTVIEQITQQIIGDTSSVKLPMYVITSYGAKGDGKTDCSAIINNIINNLPASGGTILIPEGEFLLNSPINVSKNFVTIMGLNPGLRSNVDVASSTLTNPGGGSKLILGTATAGINVPTLPDVNGKKNRISGLIIKDLLISGGVTSHGTGINILQDNDGTRIVNFVGINLATGIYVNAADAMIIKSCWVSECKNSIYLNNGIQNTVSSCQLGAQPGGITLKLDNQQNFNITGNQIYPDGDADLQVNSSTYGNISANNFQSYYLGMVELNNSSYNLLSSNIFWFRLQGSATTQLRGQQGDYGVIRVAGDQNLISSSTITCDWASAITDPVTIRSLSGTNNSYQSLKITNTSSSRVFYVNEGNEIFNCVPASKVLVDGDPTKVTIKY